VSLGKRLGVQSRADLPIFLMGKGNDLYVQYSGVLDEGEIRRVIDLFLAGKLLPFPHNHQSRPGNADPQTSIKT
jgi:hypothetical protein